MLIVSTSVFYAWLYQRSSGSVPPALALHTASNSWPSLVPVLPSDADQRAYLFVVGLVVIAAIWLLARRDDRLSSRSLPTWAEALLMRLIGSDFLFWAGLHAARDQVIQYVLATPPEQVKAASAPEQARIHGVRQDVPPRMESISYTIEVDTEEPEHRLALLHENVKKYGTVFNTVAPGTDLSGQLIRKTAL
ncbi:MAG: hypothetical protein WBK51_16310 [Polaromonas sp.]